MDQLPGIARLPDFRRRRLLGLGATAIAAGALGLGGCTRAAPLTLGYFDWPGFAFLPLAADAGLLPADAVRLRRMGTTEELTEGVRSGGMEAGAASLAWTLMMRDAGLPVRIVAVCDVSAGADALLARPGIGQVAELAGRRVAIDSAPRSQILFEQLLRAAGIALDAVATVPLGPDAAQRYAAGAFDAVLTRQPYVLGFERLGLHRLADSSDAEACLFDVLAVREDMLPNRRAALAALVRAHFDALRAWRDNRIFLDYRLARTMNVGVEDVRAVLAGIDLPDVAYNRHYLSGSQHELRAAAALCAATLRRLGLIRREPELEELCSHEFLPGETT